MLQQARYLLSLCLLLVAGCATNIPREIQEAPADNPTIREVRNNIDQYTGTTVRWGGAIASVENRQNETWIEVVATELGGYGRPLDSDSSYGRFIVRIENFLDPQIYAEGRDLTVSGVVESRIARPIGEHSYTYPLVRASAYYLWPRYSARDNDFYYRHYYGWPHSHYRFGFGYGHPYWHPHPHYW